MVFVMKMRFQISKRRKLSLALKLLDKYELEEAIKSSSVKPHLRPHFCLQIHVNHFKPNVAE